MREKLEQLISKQALARWDALTARIDAMYDVDRLWGKGFGCWEIEYKYRRGGKTLCTFYANADGAALLVTLGKAERDKFEEIKESVSEHIAAIYDSTQTLHDGKWLWLPIDEKLDAEDALKLLKIKRRPNRK